MTVYPYLARRFLHLVRGNKIILSSFLVHPFILVHIAPLGPHPFTPDQSNEVDATPFLKAFNLISSGSVGIFSSKIYQNRCIADVNPPTQKYPLPHKNGLYFGKSHLSLPAETFGIDSTSKDPSSLSTHPFDSC